MSKREFWGLDFETSGTTHEDHAPIQLGIAAPDGAMASWYIKGDWYWADECSDAPFHGLDICKVWDENAYAVHKITRETLAEKGLPIATVTSQALKFIETHSTAWRGERKLVGWNVGSFDAPFLRKFLPGISRELSYQSADLNAVTFAISKAQGFSYKSVKRQAQKQGARTAYNATGIDATSGLHDAGWDALAALGAWDYLTERIKLGY